ncbi:MAG: hypothetical protein EA398_01475 [Deltaproteobacteria bacterium]|nr:MAG: hypothetical protein EA398_01475 [Deltaproteobacteria bacterium]
MTTHFSLHHSKLSESMRHRPHETCLTALFFLVLFCAASCDDPGAPPTLVPLEAPLQHGHAGDEDVLHASLADVGLQPVELLPDMPFQRVSMILHAETPPGTTALVNFADGTSSVQTVEVTWSSATTHVARLLLDRPALSLTLHPDVPLDELFLELGPEFRGDPLRTVRRLRAIEAAPVDWKGGVVAPPDFVVPRREWGAVDPDRSCGTPHAPDRLTVHHTAGANNDRISSAETVQSIQAFHIDGRGWCDVGYHFLVGRDGRVYQGRRWSDRTGAHVGGQNEDNVGVGFLGNFVEYVPPQNMLDAGARILGWLGDTYGISLNRELVRGHGERAATLCPGAQLLSRLEGVLAAAGGGGAIDPPTTARLVGFVREGSIDNSDGGVDRARVRIEGGREVLTGANGYYVFDSLPLGEVTVHFERSCYRPESGNRTLDTAGETFWFSMPLQRMDDGDEGPVDCADPACAHLTQCEDAEPSDPHGRDTDVPEEPAPSQEESEGTNGTAAEPSQPGEVTGPAASTPTERPFAPREPAGGGDVPFEATSTAGCSASSGAVPAHPSIPMLALVLGLALARRTRSQHATGFGQSPAHCSGPPHRERPARSDPSVRS